MARPQRKRLHTTFNRIRMFTRFKKLDGTGPFTKVGHRTYQDSNGVNTKFTTNVMARVQVEENEYVWP